MRRFFLKAFFHLVKFPLRLIEFLDARLYMRLYLVSLSHLGVGFSGAPRYISSTAKFDDFERIFLGEGVVISADVILLTHDYSLTTALRSIGSAPTTDTAFLGNIRIGSNVFVGMGSVLLPGVIIGDNVIIGAGSVVRGHVPSGSVFVGNPGKVVGDINSLAHKWAARMSSTALRVDAK